MTDALWAAGLSNDAKLAKRFSMLAEDMGLSAAALISLMVAQVLAMDASLRRVGLKGLIAFVEQEHRAALVANIAMNALPTDIRPSNFMWPADIPFPWTAEECKAAVLGYQVRWTGSPVDFTHRLRGLWEIDDEDFAVLLQ